MIEQDKKLLFQDLCARLPYGVRYKGDGGWGINPYQHTTSLCTILTSEEPLVYLRPMSSMTKEEKKELKSATCPEGTGYFDEKYLICPMNHFGELISYEFMADILNWLNAHHFDYRSLIEKGLALEAPKDMYKTE